MARNSWRPRMEFNIPFKLCIPSGSEMVRGHLVKTYPDPTDPDLPVFFGNWTMWGGTEHKVNNITTVDNTGQIESWYRPDVSADCRIITPDGQIWEVIALPENIEFRNQFMRTKVRLWTGGG